MYWDDYSTEKEKLWRLFWQTHATIRGTQTHRAMAQNTTPQTTEHAAAPKLICAP